ncbi:MAG: VPLPA-CTERM sorting domain-containing protein [Acidiferrobacterales bacterium]
MKTRVGVKTVSTGSLFATMLALVASLASGGAQASVILPGGSIALSGTTESADLQLAGVVLQDVRVPFLINLGDGNAISGQVQDRVVRESSSGTLDFYYRIFNYSYSTGSIGLVGRDNYSGLTTNVDWRIDGLGTVAPTRASRSSSGSNVMFDFLTHQIAPSEQSRFFFISTNATNYNYNGTGTLIGLDTNGGFGTADFGTFEPVAPVPLPAAIWLLGSGFIGLMCVARKKRCPVQEGF